MRSPSRRNKGNTIGDDLCQTLKNAGMKRVPGPGHPNPKFVDGIQVGFYYNVCTDSSWYHTGLDVNEKACCTKRTWKNERCP